MPRNQPPSPELLVGPPVEVRLDVLCSEGRLGHPGLLLDDYGMRTGDFWDNGRIQEQLRTRGMWSTGLCEFVPWDFVPACMCPCVLVFHMLKVTGPVRVVGTGDLQIDRLKYSLVFLGLFLLSMVTPSWKSCHGERMPSHTHMIRPDGGETSHMDALDCTNYTRLGFELAHWMLVFVALRGIREKMSIKEDWWITMMKSVLCWEFCFVCQICYLAQVARHVYTSQGFVKTYLVNQGGRLVAEDPAAQPLTAMPQTAAPSAPPLSNVIEEAAE